MRGYEAERAVLGSVLRDNEVYPEVAAVLGLEDFQADAHRRLWRTMSGLLEAGKAVDTVILAEALKAGGEIEDVGGYAYLGELWDAAPTAANALHYARIVRDLSIRRQMIRVAGEIIQEAKRPTGPVEDLLGMAESKVLAISQLGLSGKVSDIGELVRDAYSRYDERKLRGGRCNGVLTGFVDLDDLTHGFHDGELVIVAARPGVGKTTLMTSIVRNVALESGEPVFVVSLEQSGAELTDKLLAREAGIDSHKIRRATLNDDELRAMMDAGSRLAAPPLLFFDSTPCQNMARIAANARRMKLRHGVRLVAVDYLQMIEPENRRVARHEQVSAISRRLKLLARDLQVPVLALAQLNRESEGNNRKPRLSDLRESGGIEADADTVLLLHREGAGEGLGGVETISVDIAKQRNGPTEEIKLAFRKGCQRFENFAGGLL